MSELWIVMPVYNEEESLPGVFCEWLPILRATASTFTLCVLNDGSKDSTLKILREMEAIIPELYVVDKSNSGHGQTCLCGYYLALSKDAKWILQIDSDGQCDPRFFPKFWAARTHYPVIYGYRKVRDDGLKRFLISRIVSIVTWMGAGTWVRDPNVPYRLMRYEALAKLVNQIPSNFHLVNILLAAFQEREYGIHWVDIHFRQRSRGVSSVKAYSIAVQGYQLFKQLLMLTRGTHT